MLINKSMCNKNTKQKDEERSEPFAVKRNMKYTAHLRLKDISGQKKEKKG